MLEERVPNRGKQPLRGWIRKVAWIVVPLAIVGELGHQLFERFGQVLAHHFFHIFFAGTAIVAFVIYAGIDIHRHGWPAFSLRLRSEKSPKTAPAAKPGSTV